VLLWGAAHISGLVCTQMWLRSVAPEAQDFATSLYLTSANAGVLSGSSAGGLSIALAGSTGAICCGVAFATLAFIVIALKIAIYGRAPTSRFGSCAGPGGSEPYGSQGGRSGGRVHSS
jgi:DHA1 family inner membrane transport protein